MLGEMTSLRLNIKYRQFGETFDSELKAMHCKNQHPDRIMYTLTDYASCDVFFNPSTRKAEIRAGAVKHIIGWLVTKVDARRRI